MDLPPGNRHFRSWVQVLPPNKPMKLTVAFGVHSLSAIRWADLAGSQRPR